MSSPAKPCGRKFTGFDLSLFRLKIVEELDAELRKGINVVIHCRQGVGRSGLVGACLLVTTGLESQIAIERISDARGVQVPETAEQRRWIEYYATTFANLK